MKKDKVAIRLTDEKLKEETFQLMFDDYVRKFNDYDISCGIKEYEKKHKLTFLEYIDKNTEDISKYRKLLTLKYGMLNHMAK